jgi:hypothetical protein
VGALGWSQVPRRACGGASIRDRRLSRMPLGAVAAASDAAREGMAVPIGCRGHALRHVDILMGYDASRL